MAESDMPRPVMPNHPDSLVGTPPPGDEFTALMDRNDMGPVLDDAAQEFSGAGEQAGSAQATAGSPNQSSGGFWKQVAQDARAAGERLRSTEAGDWLAEGARLAATHFEAGMNNSKGYKAALLGGLAASATIVADWAKPVAPEAPSTAEEASPKAASTQEFVDNVSGEDTATVQGLKERLQARFSRAKQTRSGAEAPAEPVNSGNAKDQPGFRAGFSRGMTVVGNGLDRAAGAVQTNPKLRAAAEAYLVAQGASPREARKVAERHAAALASTLGTAATTLTLLSQLTARKAA